MYLSIILFPLLGSTTSGFFGRKLGQTGAEFIGIVCVFITALLSVNAFFEVGFNNTPVYIESFPWIQSESIDVSWSFNFDSLTVSMLIPVLIVSFLVHVYSVGYMSEDPHVQRFFSYLSLFTFMMIILVTANNFLIMFVGWEGVGICSYLLVNFWFTRIAANQSSVSALLTNRVGDCFLTIGIFTILYTFGNIDYSTVFSLSPFMNTTIISMIGVCILIGAMAKSSQVGLHVWLPMAMEGPTPVSALIHAATMVTAGVYLLMRTSPLIEYSSLVLILCLWVGGITNVFSSLVGLFQQDIKKVIAYSTMSQLGMMVIAIGLSSYTVALFHLVNHAFYKALLFLAAGAVIHAVADNQDFRKYGGLRAFLPLTYSVMLIASLSLVAFPFMTGFYSKDFILESSYGQFNYSGVTIYFIATIGAMFTTLYSVKVLYLTFIARPAGPVNSYKAAHEGDIYISIPLIVLAFFSIFFGYITKDIFIGLGSGFFSDNSLFVHPSHEIMLDTEFGVPIFFKLLPLIFTITLSVLSILILEIYPKLIIAGLFTAIGHNVYSFFSQRFFIELFYNKYITEVILKLGGQTTKVLDKGSVELIGPYGLEKGLLNMSNKLDTLGTGIVTSYALFILSASILYLFAPYLFINDFLPIIVFTLFSISSSIQTNPPHTNMSSVESKINFNWLRTKLRESIERFKKNNLPWSKFFFLIISAMILSCAIRYLLLPLINEYLVNEKMYMMFNSIVVGAVLVIKAVLRSVYEAFTEQPLTMGGPSTPSNDNPVNRSISKMEDHSSESESDALFYPESTQSGSVLAPQFSNTQPTKSSNTQPTQSSSTQTTQSSSTQTTQSSSHKRNADEAFADHTSAEQSVMSKRGTSKATLTQSSSTQAAQSGNTPSIRHERKNIFLPVQTDRFTWKARNFMPPSLWVDPKFPPFPRDESKAIVYNREGVWFRTAWGSLIPFGTTPNNLNPNTSSITSSLDLSKEVVPRKTPDISEFVRKGLVPFTLAGKIHHSENIFNITAYRMFSAPIDVNLYGGENIKCTTQALPSVKGEGYLVHTTKLNDEGQFVADHEKLVAAMDPSHFVRIQERVVMDKDGNLNLAFVHIKPFYQHLSELYKPDPTVATATKDINFKQSILPVQKGLGGTFNVVKYYENYKLVLKVTNISPYPLSTTVWHFNPDPNGTNQPVARNLAVLLIQLSGPHFNVKELNSGNVEDKRLLHALNHMIITGTQIDKQEALLKIREIQYNANTPAHSVMEVTCTRLETPVKITPDLINCLLSMK